MHWQSRRPWHTGAVQSVILLPGLACDATLWREQRSALVPHHRVHISDLHFRFDTLPEMAAELLQENPGDHVLVGSSMGGMLALEVVRQAPQRVKALALLGSSARPDTTEQIRLRSEAIVMFEQGRMDQVLLANIPWAFHNGHAHQAELTGTYLAMVRRAGAAALIRQNRAVMARADQRPYLAAVACPTLVLCGESDLLTPPECSREIAQAVPGARLELLAACGHLLTLEQPQRVNQLLLEWLAGIKTPTRTGR